eukprot:CAMPEP_0174259582 /NCGR_PEP_ID=MMETSP0439-20130205/8393_1 /TAXON_ID=0 /ORGANISM="Stereomyxa ramosa, Strain Chinc5" /LENGTH=714 /DNA_ID=CAMNT_0015343529 /DNA_START=116 /DNA_END=2261 /DNA_ORIENTATION=-
MGCHADVYKFIETSKKWESLGSGRVYCSQSKGNYFLYVQNERGVLIKSVINSEAIFEKESTKAYALFWFGSDTKHFMSIQFSNLNDLSNLWEDIEKCLRGEDLGKEEELEAMKDESNKPETPSNSKNKKRQPRKYESEMNPKSKTPKNEVPKASKKTKKKKKEKNEGKHTKKLTSSLSDDKKLGQKAKTKRSRSLPSSEIITRRNKKNAEKKKRKKSMPLKRKKKRKKYTKHSLDRVNNNNISKTSKYHSPVSFGKLNSKKSKEHKHNSAGGMLESAAVQSKSNSNNNLRSSSHTSSSGVVVCKQDRLDNIEDKPSSRTNSENSTLDNINNSVDTDHSNNKNNLKNSSNKNRRNNLENSYSREDKDSSKNHHNDSNGNNNSYDQSHNITNGDCHALPLEDNTVLETSSTTTKTEIPEKGKKDEEKNQQEEREKEKSEEKKKEENEKEKKTQESRSDILVLLKRKSVGPTEREPGLEISGGLWNCRDVLRKSASLPVSFDSLNALYGGTTSHHYTNGHSPLNSPRSINSNAILQNYFHNLNNKNNSNHNTKHNTKSDTQNHNSKYNNHGNTFSDIQSHNSKYNNHSNDYTDTHNHNSTNISFTQHNNYNYETKQNNKNTESNKDTLSNGEHPKNEVQKTESIKIVDKHLLSPDSTYPFFDNPFKGRESKNAKNHQGKNKEGREEQVNQKDTVQKAGTAELPTEAEQRVSLATIQK